MFSNLAKQILSPVINILNLGSEGQSNMCETKTFHTGHEIAIIINNFGIVNESNMYKFHLLLLVLSVSLFVF